MPKKLEGGPFGIFQHPFCRKTLKKIEGGLFVEKFISRKVARCRKKLKDPLVSPGVVCYAEKLFLVQFSEATPLQPCEPGNKCG